MKILLTVVALVLSLRADEAWRGMLPAGATVVESAMVPGKDRLLVLWMERAKPWVTTYSKEEAGCSGVIGYPEAVSGWVRVSLFEASTNKLLQTLRVEAQSSPTAPMTLSRRVEAANLGYRVPQTPIGRVGQARILELRDLNGDGTAAEFYLLEFVACGIHDSTVLGYLPESDELRRFPLRVETRLQRALTNRQIRYWFPNLAQREQTRPGLWSYRTAYGHGDPNDHIIHAEYDAPRREFRVTDELRPYSSEPSTFEKKWRGN